MDTARLHNVIVLYQRLPRATYCQDCDPEGSRPFSIVVRADPRTGDILTPCPACERHALAPVPRAAGQRRNSR
jgi:hypothetical protein